MNIRYARRTFSGGGFGYGSLHSACEGEEDARELITGAACAGGEHSDTMKGWSADCPRGHVMIDPATRDIVEDEHAMEVSIPAFVPRMSHGSI